MDRVKDVAHGNAGGIACFYAPPGVGENVADDTEGANRWRGGEFSTRALILALILVLVGKCMDGTRDGGWRVSQIPEEGAWVAFAGYMGNELDEGV